MDRFVFAHALVREALYEQQSAARRVRAHHAIARGAGSDSRRASRCRPAELAHHYSESRHLDRAGKAIDYAVAGGRAGGGVAVARAGRRALPARAGGLTSRPPSARCELLLALGSAEARSGHPAARDTFARAAMLARRSVGCGGAGRAPRLGFAGRHAEAGIVDRDGIALLEEALDALGDAETRVGGLCAGAARRLARTSRTRRERTLRAQQGGAGDGAADR